MYVAVKGGERAIDNAHAFLAEERRGDPAVPELSVAQIRQQMTLAVNRVMAEGSLYDPDLAALAIKQARGDLIEAVFRREIEPILREACFKCHGAEKQKGGLRLDIKVAALEGEPRGIMCSDEGGIGGGDFTDEARHDGFLSSGR